MERKRSSASRKTTVGGVAELVAVSGQREAANSTPPAQVDLLLTVGAGVAAIAGAAGAVWLLRRRVRDA